MKTRTELSLKISLDEIIKEGLDFERKVIENLSRFSTIFGKKMFRVIFLHKKVKSEDINSFVIRNEKALFHINSKITGKDCNAWFAIESTENKNKYITYRYRYPGDILTGLVKFYEVAIYLKGKNESSDNR